MCNKKLCLASLVLVLALVSNASAVIYHWWTDADPANSNWNNPLNWDIGLVPSQLPITMQSDVYIGDAGTGTVNPAVVDGTQPCANSQWLTVGFNWVGGLDIVAGGQMGTTIWGPGELFVGAHPGGDGNALGTINIDGAGSTCRAEGWRIGNAPHGGIGIVNITNGGSMITGLWGTRLGPTATINIDGTSTMFVWGGSGSIEGMSMTTGSLIDIASDGFGGKGGVVTLAGGHSLAEANAWIAACYFAGDGIPGNVIAVVGENGLEIYVPEPATVLLLGLGGLLLRKRLA